MRRTLLKTVATTGDSKSGSVTGSVRLTLRAEGLCVLVASLVGYRQFGAGWGWFAAAFLLPDLSLMGYLAGSRMGAIAYNAAHSYVGPVACLLTALLFPTSMPLAVGLIWCAHIGFDRALGYGLKYASGFGCTHLGPIGRAAREAAGVPTTQAGTGQPADAVAAER
jgi:hypothetical protein